MLSGLTWYNHGKYAEKGLEINIDTLIDIWNTRKMSWSLQNHEILIDFGLKQRNNGLDVT